MASFASLYEKFDPAQARKLAGLIQQAYQQFDDRDEGTWQLTGHYMLRGLLGTAKIPFGFVVSELDSKDIIVVFRGTKRYVEWFKDANIQLVSYQEGKRRTGETVRAVWDIAEGVSEDISDEGWSEIETEKDFGYITAGFRGIYVSLRQELLEALQKCPPDSRIFVTGHSLGGALATLAIPDILSNTGFQDPEKVELYTFASPRCGDREFANSFRETGVSHWRIANTEDFVTMLPFPTGNIFSVDEEAKFDEEFMGTQESSRGMGEYQEPAKGGGLTGEDKNVNPLFGFFNDMFERVGELQAGVKKRMADYVHTGIPIYFTFHDAALERHHNLDEVYMVGIGQDPLELLKQQVNPEPD